MSDSIVVLDQNDLETKYKLRPFFIRRHGKAMGAFGKPKRWIESEVVLYLSNLGTKARLERENAEMLRMDQERKIEAMKSRIKSSATVVPIGAGRMMGRGGKQLNAARSSELGVRSEKKGVSA